MTEALMSGLHWDGAAVALPAGICRASAARRQPASAAAKTPALRRVPAMLGSAAGPLPRVALARTVPARMASAACTGRRAPLAGRFGSGAAAFRCSLLVRPWLWLPCWHSRRICWLGARARSTLVRCPRLIRTSSAQGPAPRAIRLSEGVRPLGGRHSGVPRP